MISLPVSDGEFKLPEVESLLNQGLNLPELSYAAIAYEYVFDFVRVGK